MYQNYQEKALHNDSDEDAESREPKPDNGIVVQYRPIRTSWSQLSVVRHDSYIFPQPFSNCRSQTHNNLCACESRNARALENAVTSSLAAVHAHPPTVSAFFCPSLCLSGSTGAFLPRLGWAGRQTVIQTHRKSSKCCWAQCQCVGKLYIVIRLQICLKCCLYRGVRWLCIT